jgi:hypothetical protein
MVSLSYGEMLALSFSLAYTGGKISIIYDKLVTFLSLNFFQVRQPDHFLDR